MATEVVAYEDFDDGTRVEVVTYVHGEVEPVTVYPSIVWAGRVYYNVGGHFVHFSPSCDCWVYYRAPPPPLVVVWNQAYPTYPIVGGHGPGGCAPGGAPPPAPRRRRDRRCARTRRPTAARARVPAADTTLRQDAPRRRAP